MCQVELVSTKHVYFSLSTSICSQLKIQEAMRKKEKFQREHEEVSQNDSQVSSASVIYIFHLNL